MNSRNLWQFWRALMSYLNPSDDKFKESICCYCFDIVTGSEKTKGADFYRLNGKIYCGLTCYGEEKQELKDEITAKDIKFLDKIAKRPKKTYKVKAKIKKIAKAKPLKYKKRD